MLIYIITPDNPQRVVPVTLHKGRVSAPSFDGGRDYAARGIDGMRRVMSNAIERDLASLDLDDVVMSLDRAAQL